MSIKKVDIINGAYSQLQVSGVTVVPTAADYSLALSRLDDMMAQWFEQWELNLGYDYSSTPNINSYVAVSLGNKQVIESNLAVALCADFGKTPPSTLVAAASSSLSVLIARMVSASAKKVQMPSWFPVGSGSPYSVQPEVAQKEADASVITLVRGESRTGVIEDFADFLGVGTTLPTISSQVITASTGLTVSAATISGQLVTYTLSASTTGTANSYVIKIQITDSLGRICVRARSVFVTDPPEV